MRTIVKKIELYTIEELKGESLWNAIEEIKMDREEISNSFAVEDFMQSLLVFADKFDFTIGKYDVQVPNNGDNFVDIDMESYMLETNKTKNDLVKKINETFKEEYNGKCSLTGVSTDCYLYEYFYKNNGISFNTFHKDIPKAVNQAVKSFVENEVKNIQDYDQCIKYAKDTSLEFLENGKMY